MVDHEKVAEAIFQWTLKEWSLDLDNVYCTIGEAARYATRDSCIESDIEKYLKNDKNTPDCKPEDKILRPNELKKLLKQKCGEVEIENIKSKILYNSLKKKLVKKIEESKDAYIVSRLIYALSDIEYSKSKKLDSHSTLIKMAEKIQDKNKKLFVIVCIIIKEFNAGEYFKLIQDMFDSADFDI